MVINTNIAAQSAANLLAQSSNSLSESLQRLSSGSKIVSPSDDPAGLAVSTEFTALSSRIGAAVNNVTDATSFTQTQSGFMQQVSSALNQMSQLAVSSQDVTKTDTDRGLYNQEYQQLAQYVASVATQSFNGVSLFDNTTKNVTIDGEGTTWGMAAINLGNAAYTAVDATSTTNNISTTGAATTALTNVETAIDQLSQDNATIGANMVRLNYTSNDLTTQQTNIDAANSAISDTDVAQESTNYAKLQILVQSGTAMLAQANQMPQSMLKLLS